MTLKDDGFPPALQAVLDHAPIGIWYQDPSGRLKFVNRAFCEAVGVSEQRFLSVPHYGELFDAASAEACRVSDQAALAHEGPRNSREQLRFVDNQVHDLDIIKLKVTGAEGEFVGLLGLSTDVTERLRSDAAMKRQVAGLRRLNEASAQPGLDLRESLRGTLRAALEHFGMEYAVIGRLATATELSIDVQVSPAGTLSDGMVWHLAQAPCGPMLASGEFLAVADEVTPVDLPGVGHLELRSYLGVPLRDQGEVTGSLCLFSTHPRPTRFDEGDIEFLRLLGRLVEATRDRGAAIQRLDEARAQSAAIIDSAMDAMITHDGDQRVVLFNAAAEHMFRCRAADAIGKPLDHFLPERFRAAHRRQVDDFARDGATHRSMGGARVWALRTDGEEFPCEATISRVKVEGRTLLTVILRDVTERERAEVVRRALELKAQQVQKMDALGTLAAGIAHDLNNVLSTIMLNAEIAQHELPTGEVRESVDDIVTAGQRARDLIKRILTFSRKQAVTRAPASLQLAVEDALGFLRAALPAGIELVETLEPSVGPVASDPIELHQVVVNLCTNAWHAIGDRAGRIEFHLIELFLEAEPDFKAGRYARLTVTDSGSGMNAETLSRVFEPFFTTKAPGDGTGLGLSVVHGIVSDLGGRVSASSEPGRGAVFTVDLPVAAAGPAPGAAGPRSPHTTGQGQRILVLDDEPGIVRAVSVALRRAGYDVHPFTSADAALAALALGEPRFSAMVIDVNMPDLSGLEFVRRAARHPSAGPVVLTSGNMHQAQHEEAEKLGVRCFLQKPYKASELCVQLSLLAAT